MQDKSQSDQVADVSDTSGQIHMFIFSCFYVFQLLSVMYFSSYVPYNFYVVFLCFSVLTKCYGSIITITMLDYYWVQTSFCLALLDHASTARSKPVCKYRTWLLEVFLKQLMCCMLLWSLFSQCFFSKMRNRNQPINVK